MLFFIMYFSSIMFLYSCEELGLIWGCDLWKYGSCLVMKVVMLCVCSLLVSVIRKGCMCCCCIMMLCRLFMLLINRCVMLWCVMLFSMCLVRLLYSIFSGSCYIICSVLLLICLLSCMLVLWVLVSRCLGDLQKFRIRYCWLFFKFCLMKCRFMSVLFMLGLFSRQVSELLIMLLLMYLFQDGILMLI